MTYPIQQDKATTIAALLAMARALPNTWPRVEMLQICCRIWQGLGTHLKWEVALRGVPHPPKSILFKGAPLFLGGRTQPPTGSFNLLPDSRFCEPSTWFSFGALALHAIDEPSTLPAEQHPTPISSRQKARGCLGSDKLVVAAAGQPKEEAHAEWHRGRHNAWIRGQGAQGRMVAAG